MSSASTTADPPTGSSSDDSDATTATRGSDLEACPRAPPPRQGGHKDDEKGGEEEEEDGDGDPVDIMLCGWDWIRFHAAAAFNRYVLCRPDVTFGTLAGGREVRASHRCTIAAGWLMVCAVLAATAFFLVCVLAAMAVLVAGSLEGLGPGGIAVAAVALACGVASFCCVCLSIIGLQLWRVFFH